MNGWEKMFEGWHERYYDVPFMIVCELYWVLFIKEKARLGNFLFVIL
jgi:hypothetical protein